MQGYANWKKVMQILRDHTALGIENFYKTCIIEEDNTQDNT
jgi:hypothetical protein